MNKAIEIIASGTVAGAAEEHLPTLMQAPSLAQLRSSSEVRSPSQARAAAFLAQRAQATGSRILAMLAVSAQADPLKKVKKIIKDLIVKLMEEATAEAEHKGWCDTELTTNKQARDKHTEDVNQLTT